MNSVTDNIANSRFELNEQGKTGFARYRLTGPVMEIPHVEVDPSLRGTGAAGRLMEGVLEQARLRNLKVKPICGYAAAYIQRHPEHHDLLADPPLSRNP